MSYLLALCLALCWGTAFLATKNIVDVLPPYWGTFFRVLAELNRKSIYGERSEETLWKTKCMV